MFWKRITELATKLTRRGSLKFGDAYAAEAGYFAGQLFVFVEKNTEGEYGFLRIPNMENEFVPKEKFDFAVSNGILVYVESLPRFVRNTTKLKFKENLKNEAPIRIADTD
jgi:hypothetical protein